MQLRPNQGVSGSEEIKKNLEKRKVNKRARLKKQVMTVGFAFEIYNNIDGNETAIGKRFPEASSARKESLRIERTN